MQSIDLELQKNALNTVIINIQKILHSDWQWACQLIPNSAKTWNFLVQKDEISAESWN